MCYGAGRDGARGILSRHAFHVPWLKMYSCCSRLKMHLYSDASRKCQLIVWCSEWTQVIDSCWQLKMHMYTHTVYMGGLGMGDVACLTSLREGWVRAGDITSLRLLWERWVLAGEVASLSPLWKGWVREILPAYRPYGRAEYGRCCKPDTLKEVLNNGDVASQTHLWEGCVREMLPA
jgi:hypothetical protein